MSVVSIIENELEKKAQVNFKPMQLGDVKKTFADIDKSKNKARF